jgi:hypothetical protein
MNALITNPITPAKVSSYFLAQLPKEELPGTFFDVASQSLLHSLAAFFSGTATRPSCTLENIVAAIRYPHIGHVLNMLSTDSECDVWVLHLQTALARHAVLQVAGVTSYIDIILGHIRPDERAQQRVHAFISAFAA